MNTQSENKPAMISSELEVEIASLVANCENFKAKYPNVAAGKVLEQFFTGFENVMMDIEEDLKSEAAQKSSLSFTPCNTRGYVR